MGGLGSYMRGKLPEKGAWTVCRFERGWQKRRVVVFFRGVDTSMHNIVFSGGQFDHLHPYPLHISRTDLISIKLHEIFKRPI